MTINFLTLGFWLLSQLSETEQKVVYEHNEEFNDFLNECLAGQPIVGVAIAYNRDTLEIMQLDEVEFPLHLRTSALTELYTRLKIWSDD